MLIARRAHPVRASVCSSSRDSSPRRTTTPRAPRPIHQSGEERRLSCPYTRACRRRRATPRTAFARLVVRPQASGCVIDPLGIYGNISPAEDVQRLCARVLWRRMRGCLARRVARRKGCNVMTGTVSPRDSLSLSCRPHRLPRCHDSSLPPFSGCPCDQLVEDAILSHQRSNCDGVIDIGSAPASSAVLASRSSEILRSRHSCRAEYPVVLEPAASSPTRQCTAAENPLRRWWDRSESTSSGVFGDWAIAFSFRSDQAQGCSGGAQAHRNARGRRLGDYLAGALNGM